MQLILLSIPIILVAFWVWMFYDMLNNDDIPSTAAAGFRWPPETKSHWIIFFIIFSIFTAGYYYFIEYKNRRQL